MSTNSQQSITIRTLDDVHFAIHFAHDSRSIHGAIYEFYSVFSWNFTFLAVFTPRLLLARLLFSRLLKLGRGAKVPYSGNIELPGWSVLHSGSGKRGRGMQGFFILTARLQLRNFSDFWPNHSSSVLTPCPFHFLYFRRSELLLLAQKIEEVRQCPKIGAHIPHRWLWSARVLPAAAARALTERSSRHWVDPHRANDCSSRTEGLARVRRISIWKTKFGCQLLSTDENLIQSGAQSSRNQRNQHVSIEQGKDFLRCCFHEGNKKAERVAFQIATSVPLIDCHEGAVSIDASQAPAVLIIESLQCIFHV